MKRRRTLIVSLLLVAALCMGIGYAAVSGTLTVKGDVTIKEQPFDVKFTEMTSVATPNTITVTDVSDLSSNPSNQATLTVASLQNKGDTVTVTYTIENFNDVAVDLATPTITLHGTDNTYTNTNASKYTVTAKYNGNADTASLDAAGGASDSATLVVTITLTSVYTGTDSNVADETIHEYFTIALQADENTP